jgi:rubrerythrin
MAQHRRDQIEMMALHEEAIADLYKAFADSFPDFQDFWSRLSTEEVHHAEWLRQLRTLIEQGKARLADGRFRIEPIERSIKYIEGYARQARGGQMSILNAFSIARDIEHALLEKKFLEVYESDDEHVAKTIKTLQDATDGHRKMIDDELQKLQQPGPTPVD